MRWLQRSGWGHQNIKITKQDPGQKSTGRSTKTEAIEEPNIPTNLYYPFRKPPMFLMGTIREEYRIRSTGKGKYQ